MGIIEADDCLYKEWITKANLWISISLLVPSKFSLPSELSFSFLSSL